MAVRFDRVCGVNLGWLGAMLAGWLRHDPGDFPPRPR
jgi:hypothetical protein